MLISLSPTIFDAGQLFRGRGEGAKSTVQDQKKFISKCAPLSKLIHNHTSPDRVARLSRWYKDKLLPKEDSKTWDSYLLKVRSLISYGFHLSQTLEALSEEANALSSAFNALAPEEQEHKYPHIQEALQALYAKQQTIYALLDRAPEENQEDSPVLKEMQEIGIDLASTGLVQHIQALNQELSRIEQEEEPHTTSLVKYVISVPRTETVIGSIAALVGALGVILQIPTIVCVLSAFLAISMIIIRCVKSIISDKQHAKKHDMLILREVMSQYMETVNNAIRAIFQIKQDTSNIKQDTTDIKGALGRLEEKINNAPPAITYNVIQVVDPKYLLPPEQQLLLGQGSTRPAITLSGEDSTEIRLGYQQRQSQDVIIANHTRARKVSSSSVASSPSSSGSDSPTIGRSPTPESDEEGRSLSQGQASSSFKGKERAEDYVVMSRSEVEALKQKANIQPVKEQQIDSDNEDSSVSDLEGFSSGSDSEENINPQIVKRRREYAEYKEYKKKIAILKAAGISIA